jgi:hypothetical protein
MKASMGFGLGGHDRFLIPFVLGAITFVYCDVGNIIIRLCRWKQVRETGLSEPLHSRDVILYPVKLSPIP